LDNHVLLIAFKVTTAVALVKGRTDSLSLFVLSALKNLEISFMLLNQPNASHYHVKRTRWPSLDNRRADSLLL